MEHREVVAAYKERVGAYHIHIDQQIVIWVIYDDIHMGFVGVFAYVCGKSDPQPSGRDEQESLEQEGSEKPSPENAEQEGSVKGVCPDLVYFQDYVFGFFLHRHTGNSGFIEPMSTIVVWVGSSK